MKLIHCADLHLDSRMTTNLEGVQARERRAELLNTYQKMVAYAAENGVTGILIAGDLFDTRNVSAMARDVIRHSIEKHPEITFFYLRGNHDSDELSVRAVPGNLKLFDDSWTSLRMGRVVVSGMELNHRNSRNLAEGLRLNREDFNIVMLHGQVTETGADTEDEMIDLRSLRGQHIDYLALGHIHSYCKEHLDARGTWCYPGCLEGRGYDECGEHGFMLLEINEEEGRMVSHFVPFAFRRLLEIPVDVTGCSFSSEMAVRADQAIAASGCRKEDMVHLILRGEVDVESESNAAYIKVHLKEHFYHVKVTDETRLAIDPEHFRLDESLRGAFVRLVLTDEELDDADKNTVIRYGLLALAGEDI